MKGLSIFKITGWLAFSLSFYTHILIYKFNPSLLILLFGPLLYVFLCLLCTSHKVKTSLSCKYISSLQVQYFSLVSCFIYFSTALYGLIWLVWKSPFVDKSILVIPTLVAILFVTGAAINLHNDDNF